MAEKREIGGTGVWVPAIGFGTSGIGHMPDTYGYDVDEARALATVRAVLALPDGFLDSSRHLRAWGGARSGSARWSRELGGWPEGRVLSTKLDRDAETGRFDAAQARRSLEESLAALGVDRVDILHLHDPEHARGPGRDRRRGRRAGRALPHARGGAGRAVGLAAGRIDVMMPLLRDWDFDVLITHNRHTLVNRNAEPMLDAGAGAGDRGAERGALCRRARCRRGRATGATSIRRRPRGCWSRCGGWRRSAPGTGCRRGRRRCSSRMRDPRITATICGVTRPERVQETLDWAAWPIGEEVWAELLALPFATDDPEATRDYKLG